jgi:DNA-binding GntR family transcriptional regulator
MQELAGEMEGLAGRFDDHEEEIWTLVGLNQEFHGTIVEASRNRRLKRLISRTVEIPLMFKSFFWYTPHERVISNHYHRQILEALVGGDADRAEIIMREHVYEGRDFVIRALEGDMNA